MKKWLTLALTASAGILAIFFLTRIFVCDGFVISGESMEPTLAIGEKVYVNKLRMGARIYTDFDFSKPELHCFRMPGFGRLRVGDVAIFNYQDGWEDGRIGFRINYVYCKRCIGCPGDSVSIIDGFYHNSRVPYTGTPEYYQEMLSMIDEASMKERGIARWAYYTAFPGRWTIKNFGPLYIPAKGDVIVLDSENVALYGKEIEYETGVRPIPAEDAGSQPVYTFKNNWYFFGGDNVLNSRDSRYIGLVPEDFLVGVVILR